MTTSTTAPGPTAAGQHLASIAASLSAYGLVSHLTRSGGTPVLTVNAPGGGPDPATIAIHPDPYADPDSCPGTWLDCTCIWTPAPDASPYATAAVITSVLNATRLGSAGPSRSQPSKTDAARLADFLHRHPGWSAFWDSRYRLWRAAEDDPASILYVETPDLDAVMTYITSHSLRKTTLMTGTTPEDPAPPEDLTARVFRALYDQFDLHTAGGTHIAVPKGTPCFAAPTIGEIAQRISDSEQHVPAPPDAAYRPDETRQA